jgi:hypothetical protein
MLMPKVSIAKYMKYSNQMIQDVPYKVMFKVVNAKQSQIGGRGCFVKVDETHIFLRK